MDFCFDPEFDLPEHKEKDIQFRLVPESQEITSNKVINFLEDTLGIEEIFENEEENIIRASSMSNQFSFMSKQISKGFKNNFDKILKIFEKEKDNTENSENQHFLKEFEKILNEIFQGSSLKDDGIEFVSFIFGINFSAV